MRNRAKITIIVTASLLIGLGLIMHSIKRYWIWENKVGGQVLWNKGECFLFLQKRTLGWSGSYLEELLLLLKQLAGVSGVNDHLRDDVVVFHFVDNKLEKHYLSAFTLAGQLFPYKGAIYASLDYYWRWTGSEFVQVSDVEAEEIKNSYVWERDLLAKENWFKYETEISSYEPESILPIELMKARLTLILRTQENSQTVLLKGPGLNESGEVLLEVDRNAKKVSKQEYEDTFSRKYVYLWGKYAKKKGTRGLYVIKKDGRFGYVNNNGEIIIEPQFEDASSFSEGIGAILVGGKYGYINETGRTIINPQFESARDFSEGLAAAKIAGKWGYIDKSGTFVIKPVFEDLSRISRRSLDEASSFSEGLAFVKYGDKFDYIDATGEKVFELEAQYGHDFSEGLAVILNDKNKKGYIDRNGKIAISTEFEEAGRFSEGLAAIKRGEKWGYIDKTGKIAINPDFDFACGFSEGLAPIKVGTKYGFIDKTGRIVIKPQFDLAFEFSEGLAGVEIEGKRGYINKSGSIEIAPQFDLVSDFSEGLARVMVGDSLGYIDKSGKYIWSLIK